jgi:hypothetical protein
VFTHEMNRDQKPILEVAETGLSGWANWRVRFYRDQRQVGAPLGFNECSSSIQVAFGRWRGMNHDNFGG